MVEDPNVERERPHQFRRKLNNFNSNPGDYNVCVTEDNSVSCRTFITHEIEGDESVTTGSVSGSWTGRMRAIQAAEDEAVQREVLKANNKQSKCLYNQNIVNIKNETRTRNSNVSSKDNLSSDILLSSSWSSRGFIHEGAYELKNIARNDPPIAAALSVSSAAVVGAMVMGPIGLLVGAASVGVAAGFMQIPEERIKYFSKRAVHIMQRVCLSIEDTNEVFYDKCGDKSYKYDSDDVTSGFEKRTVGSVSGHISHLDTDIEYSSITQSHQQRLSGDETKKNHRHGLYSLTSHSLISPGQNNLSLTKSLGYRAVACRRRVKIIPVGKIHSLHPSLQPRSWLDVMASMFSTREEKNEAMEEILILSKDKNNARMFIEEGIIDSLLYIIRMFFKSYVTKEINMTNGIKTLISSNVNPRLFHAKLASNCCIALGKAHCALVHTEGDLLLMSSYYHGTVPVSRQLAQMLHEVPYNVPTFSDNGRSESFKLAEISLQGAEDLAKCIFELAEGRISTYNQYFD